MSKESEVKDSANKMVSLNEKLLSVQSQIKAQKTSKNDFGNYNYRNIDR